VAAGIASQFPAVGQVRGVRNAPQVFKTIIRRIPVDVIDLQPLWDRAEVPNPDEAMAEQRGRMSRNPNLQIAALGSVTGGPPLMPVQPPRVVTRALEG
jgi:hypothetical protein